MVAREITLRVREIKMKKTRWITPLKSFVGAVTLLSVGHIAFADCVTNGLRAVVAPNFKEFTTSPSGGGTFTDRLREQEVYRASQFPSGPIVIRELRWRPSIIYGTNFSVTLSDVEIHLSTTAAAPGGLSST